MNAAMHLQIWTTLLALLLIKEAESDCTTRRCLAEMLIKKNLKSQPQAESCTTVVRIPEMEYQTLAVDTKRLRLISRLTATLEWTDPEMAWDTNVYPYDRASLPVDSVWTPAVYVTNAITVESQPSGKDLVVLSDGTLKHDVIVNAEVNCEINLFNYPFAADSCPVALHTWFSSGCGGEMSLWNVTMKDGAHGDWETQSIFYYQLEQNRNYILVDLKLRHINPFVTLMLPSILIIMADVVSFALPLGCGERNSFKVTLVLSFTMFLIILNGELPGDGQCSPIIRIHFCVCLVILVLSMLVSMILTRVAKEGGLIFCCCSKWITPKKDEVMDEETTPDVSFIQTEPEGEHTRILREVVRFLQSLDQKEAETEKYERLADTLDKIFFWFYCLSCIGYFSGMFYVLVNRTCIINHFEFY